MQVKFIPQNVTLEIKPGESVLDLARNNGIFIKSICGGVPSCAECRVKVVEGQKNILPPSFKEKALIGSAYHIDFSRLSCQIKCMGNITVDLTEQIEKEKNGGARKAGSPAFATSKAH
jgi:2Fe-2S ferredoxin